VDLGDIRIDLKKEAAGVWIEIDDETSLLVARWENPKHRDLQAQQMAKARLSSGLINAGQAEQILNHQIAETILIGWKGMKENGKELEYSPEEAVRILSDPVWRPFRDMVMRFATDERRYREEVIETALGN
jgi:hypothetical protein